MDSDKKWIATCVALIPEINDESFLFELNRALAGGSESSFLFDGNHRPHITLMQDFIESSKLSVLEKSLADIDWQGISELTVSGVERSCEIEKGVFTPCLEVCDSGDYLSKLHRQVMDCSSALSSNSEVLKGEFCDHVVHPKCHHYVQNFSQFKSYENFYPHLTLGISRNLSQMVSVFENMTFPKTLRVDSVVLAQLGDICTIPLKTYWEKNLP